MTTPTSQILADALRSAGFTDLASRAEKDEFHDFMSPHATPELMLADLLQQESTIAYQRDDGAKAIAAQNIRRRLINGEFDASKAESEAWAKSQEGQEALSMLVKGTKQ